MSKFKKLTDFLKSLKCRLILLCILIGIVPGVLLRAGMLGSYENRAVSIRTSEILSQAKILANQIVSNDYLNNAESESAINVQLEQLSTIYDGRVMIIDEEFHIIKDTYNLDTGKTIISEEVIKSIQGEEISKYDSQNRYIEMTIPLVHVDPETENKRTIGVIMVSVSTDSINLNLEYLARNTLVMELIAIVAIIFAGTFIAIHLVAPFHAMAKSIEEIQTGYGDDALKINAYTETRQICEKFNKMLGRMKVLDDSRQEFVSNVSHELKTPIALIQGYAEGLKECINDDAESRDFYCEVIMDEAAKMNNMVKKLLTLNHLESGKDAIVFERFDLTKLVRTVVHSAELLADQKGAKILFEETESYYVWADEFKTEEVVTNFVSNAINHVDFDKVIEIKMKKENGKVHTSVFNTGIPIPEADIDKIWIKFYKVDKARTREYGGSGIGLSIVKAIMDSMHQKFGVKNYDNGVEFWFELEADNGREMKSEMTEEFAKPVEVKGEKTEQNEP